MPLKTSCLKKAKLLNLKQVLFFLFGCFYLSAYSQSSIQINGVVVDEKNAAVADASIQVKNTSKGVISDSTGKFSINVPDKNAILVITHIGFTTKEIPVPQS